MDIVLFVKNEDEITAVFITEAIINGDTSLMECYSHVGQHSTCSWDWVSGSDVVQAEYNEYRALMAELEDRGYTDMRIVTYAEIYDAMGGVGFEFLDDEELEPSMDIPVPKLTGLMSIMVSDEFIKNTLTAAISEMLGQKVSALGLRSDYRDLKQGVIPRDDDLYGWEIKLDVST